MLGIKRFLPLVIAVSMLAAIPAIAGVHSESGYLSGVSDFNPAI